MKKLKQEKPQRICLDIETHPFSDYFLSAKTRADKIKFLPEPRIVCVFKESSKRYEFFYPNDESMQRLSSILNNSVEVISYNGDQFDFLVLERYYPELFTGIGERIKSVDMMLIAQEATDCDYNFSLDKMSKVNLGEGKMVAGREMNSLDIEKIKTACKSDVIQTYKLWSLWRSGKIQYPPHNKRRKWGIVSDIVSDYDGTHVVLPGLCPNCGDVNSVEIIDEEQEDLDDMTDGQRADCMAGWNRATVCTTCGMIFTD
jgi:hypothetical protein